MPMFICSNCSGIENTACGLIQYKDTGKYAGAFANPAKTDAFCSECKPRDDSCRRYPGGIWHGEFAKEIATEEIVLARGLWPHGNNGFMHLGKFEYLRPKLESP